MADGRRHTTASCPAAASLRNGWYPNLLWRDDTPQTGPFIAGENQLYGDGSVRWKPGAEFDLSNWSTTAALWSNAIHFDGFFY